MESACGSGNFFGLVPDSFQDSRLFGVELDSNTGRLAKQLYPGASITCGERGGAYLEGER
ncbi:hypothetical protein MHH56_04930 [Paenibacillus sp. FSL K6-3182]|uniref:hypothetical protein n=1 Tax=Paenibacillus sp. FSL K6-3182 TaxID=2921495 RepID=UPI0030CEDA5B